jgi:hypothetical protein
MDISAMLGQIKDWAGGNDKVRAVLLVDFYARGRARPF